MSAHTPGPWSWGERERGLYGTGEGSEILTYESYEGMWVSYTDHREANMRLIAAAPELLSALERIIRRVDGNSYCLGAEVLAIALPAVTKATTP